MAKKKSDGSTQKFLFGRIPVNRNAAPHTRARSQPTRDTRAAQRAVVRMEKARDKFYPHSADWKRLDEQIERYKREQGL